MQQHGQTVFMLEQLQPTWLATPGQRAVYIFGSRSMVGLIYGLLFGMAFCPMMQSTAWMLVSLAVGFMSGLSLGFVDLFRWLWGVQTANPRTPTTWQVLKSVCILAPILFMNSIFVAFSVVVMLFILNSLVPTGPESSATDRVKKLEFLLGLMVMIEVPVFAITWGRRNAQRTLACDIQGVENLTWSWKDGAKAYALWLIVGAAIGVITGPIFGWENGAGMFVMIAGPVGIVLGTLGAFRTSVQDLKTVPNQGIRLSIRSALRGALIAGLFFGLIFGSISSLNGFTTGTNQGVGGPSPWVQLGRGLVDGLVIGLAGGLFAGSLFGGLDVLLHYILRLLLSMTGRTPLNLVHFLDYAAQDLNFLQKVGGGYIFIHRMLLEHFAAMGSGATEKSLETVQQG
jgi:hypothetical protein